MKSKKLAAIIGLGFVTSVVGSLGILSNIKKEIEPQVFADVNGDGVEDALIWRISNVGYRPTVSYFDGRNVSQEDGKYVATGFAQYIEGVVGIRKEIRNDERKGIVTGNWNEDPRGDLRVYVPTPDFPINFEQTFYDVLPKGGQE